MLDAEKFEKLMDDLRIERHSPRWIDCGIVWHLASAAGMTRAAEICSQMMYNGYTPPEHGAAAEYYQEGVGDCADAIRAEITKENRDD
jgi:hypothetical protein